MRLHQRGLTLIELLVAISVAAILLAVGVPSFQNTFANNALTATSRDLASTLNTARMQAVNVRSDVSVSPVDGNWNSGWKLAAARPDLLEEQDDPFSPRSKVTVNQVGTTGAVTFFARGGVNNGGAVFKVCHADLDEGRRITISFLGKIQTAIEACNE